MTETPAGQNFADLLRRYRRAAHLTQEELAERTGLSARGISDLERGARRAPHRETVRMIARALGLAPEEAASLDASVVRLRDGDSETPALPPSRFELPGGATPPAPLTSFVGRERDVTAAVHLLRRGDVRLLTLTGPGGVGKTRLAIRVAYEVAGDYADGVAFVALAPLADPALVLPTIARALGVAEVGARPPAEALAAFLRDRQLLLLLDNFEQVAAAAADVVRLLEACPRLVALVTSRAALGVRGEQQIPVAPLAVPHTEVAPAVDCAADEIAAQYPAVRLLLDRARAVVHDFVPTPATLPALLEICRRLDGLPLAIELAAPRLKLLSPPELLARIERRLPELTADARDGPDRHRTLRAAIAWSYDLLAPGEQRLFRRLAVFAGGCTLDAAEAVCGEVGGDVTDGDVLDGVTSLLDKSLLYVATADSLHGRGDGERRVGMLETIREYALERLETSGEADDAKARHAGHYLTLAEEAALHVHGVHQAEWVDRLEREIDNLRAAMAWMQEHKPHALEIGLRLSVALWWFWYVRGYSGEGRRWLAQLLADETAAVSADAPIAATWRAPALHAAGHLALWQGDEGSAATLLNAALALARDVNDPRTAALALNELGVLSAQSGGPERAEQLFQDSLTLARTVGDGWLLSRALSNLGSLAYHQGSLEEAASAWEEALAKDRLHGDKWGMAALLSNLGAVAERQGDVRRAGALVREALAHARTVGDRGERMAGLLETMASVAAASGQGARAARLVGAASALRDTVGAPLPRLTREDVGAVVALARAALGEEQWAEAFDAGRALSLEEAVAEALANPESERDGPPSARAAEVAGATPQGSPS